jgi:hypothetical protein
MLQKDDIVKRCSGDPDTLDNPEDNMFEGCYYKIRERDEFGGVYLEGHEGYYNESFFTLEFRPCEKTSVEITQGEYDSLIDEINMLRELLAEAYKPRANVDSTAEAVPAFKPISEMTMEDWIQAQEEEGVFVDNDGDEVEVESVSDYFVYFYGYVGAFDFEGKHTFMPEDYHIVKRIK